MTERADVLVVSHQRSGTHLMIDAIANNFDQYGKGYLNLDRLSSKHGKPMTLKQFTARLAEGPRIVKTHMHADYKGYFDGDSQVTGFVEQMLRSARIIYVYRDGRDVLVSLYFYVQSWMPRIADISFSQFIRMNNELNSHTYQGDLTRIQYWKRHVSGWYHCGRENITFVSFEQLVDDYAETINRLALFLDSQPPGRTRDVRRTGSRRARPQNLADRLLEKLGKAYHRYIRNVKYTSQAFRQGNVGDHKAWFCEEDLDYFDAIASDLMTELGYSALGQARSSIPEGANE